MSAITESQVDRAKVPLASSLSMRAIGETGKYINGVAFKPTDWSDEGLPIVRIQNLTDPTRPMNRTTRIVDPAYMVQPGDLLVSWSATLDAFIWEREPALLNQHIFKVVPNTDLVSKKYLFFALRQAIIEMGRTEHLHGSTMKHINRGPFLAHRIRVPPLQAQAAIVVEVEKQFSRLDEAVANLKRVKANLARFRASVYQAAVEGALTTEPNMADVRSRAGAEGAEALLARVRELHRMTWKQRGKYRAAENPSIESLPRLPAGWVWATWGQVGHSQNGRAFPSSEYIDGGVRLLRPGNLHQAGEVVWDEGNTRHLPEKYAASDADLIVEGGELVMNLTAQSLKDEFLGRVCLTRPGERCLLNQRLARLTPCGFSARYALVVFKSRWFRAFVDELNTGSLIQHMFTSQLERFPFSLPPLEEQDRIVAEVDRRLSIAREVEAEVDANLRRAEGLRQAMLARHFAGHD